MTQRIVILTLKKVQRWNRNVNKLGAATILCIANISFSPLQAQAASGQGFAQWPDECHAQSSVENALRANAIVPPMYGDRLDYLKHIRKYDVVCVGKEITVSTPIFTNGGDVVIFADSVRIAAPIRTTVGRSDVFDSAFLDTYTGLVDTHSQARVRYKNVIKVIRSSRLPSTRSLERAYRDYYKCTDGMELQPQPICFDRPSGFTHPFFDWALSRPHVEMGFRQHDGVPAPDEYLDEAVYRSGSVFIFARRMILEGGEY